MYLFMDSLNGGFMPDSRIPYEHKADACAALDRAVEDYVGRADWIEKERIQDESGDVVLSVVARDEDHIGRVLEVTELDHYTTQEWKEERDRWK